MGPWYDTAWRQAERNRMADGGPKRSTGPDGDPPRVLPNLSGGFVTYTLLALMIVTQAVVL